MTKTKISVLLTLLVVAGIAVSFLVFYKGGGAATLMPRLGADARVKTVTVPGTQTTWLDTGFELLANKWYDVSGTGEVCFSNINGTCLSGATSNYYGWCYPGTANCTWPAYCSYFESDCYTDPFNAYSHASVIVKVGEGECGAGAECYGSLGPSQAIGSIRTTTKKKVYVMVNDHTGGDNTGSFTMKFERQN